MLVLTAQMDAVPVYVDRTLREVLQGGETVGHVEVSDSAMRGGERSKNWGSVREDWGG